MDLGSLYAALGALHISLEVTSNDRCYWPANGSCATIIALQWEPIVNNILNKSSPGKMIPLEEASFTIENSRFSLIKWNQKVPTLPLVIINDLCPITIGKDSTW